MTTIGLLMGTSIKELRDHLSMYLHQVQNGKELIITSHKHPVAKIIPYPKNTKEKKLLEEKKRAAVIKKFHADLAELDKKLKDNKLTEPLSETVIRMRREAPY